MAVCVAAANPDREKCDSCGMCLNPEPDRDKHEMEQKIVRLEDAVEQKGRENRHLTGKLERQKKRIDRQNGTIDGKDRKIARLDRKIDLLENENKNLQNRLENENSLWERRGTVQGGSAGKKEMLHRFELFNEIIHNSALLYFLTMLTCEKFEYVLEHGREFMMRTSQMPLFWDNAVRKSDPGNRCKLTLDLALLMGLMYKKGNITQVSLGTLFGINQSAVSRYIRAIDQMLTEVLPTADKIAEEISNTTSKEKLKNIIPGPGLGRIFIDGTHVRILRCITKCLRRMMYSGKKKAFTLNTNVYTNSYKVIIGISDRVVGSVGDFALLKDHPMPFGRWEKMMHDSTLPLEDRIHVCCDRGYQGIASLLEGIVAEIPYKRHKNRPLTREQKVHNHRINSTRIIVEHAIGRLKQFRRLAGPYNGKSQQFSREFNIITGLANLNTLWDHVRKGPPPPGRWETVVDWAGASTLAPAEQ